MFYFHNLWYILILALDIDAGIIIFCETVDKHFKICYYTNSSSTFVVEGIGEPGLNF